VVVENQTLVGANALWRNTSIYTWY